MNLIKCITLLLTVSIMQLSQTASAQSISAPGWNAEPLKNGGTSFRHESGDGTLSLNKVDLEGANNPEPTLITALKAMTKYWQCPGYQTATITPPDNSGYWQIKSFEQGITCSIIAKAVSPNSAYIIVFNDNKNGATGAEAFAQKIAIALPSTSIPIATSTQQPAKPSAPNASEVVGVIFDNTQSRTTYNMTSWGASTQFTEFFILSEVLFTNGTACRDCLEDWVKDPTLAEYRRDTPDDMGRWSKDGSGYTISYPDDKEARKVLATELVRPTRAGTTFNNLVLESVGGSASGSGDYFSTSIQTDRLFLGKDGRFLWGTQFQGYSEVVVASVLSSAKPTQKGRYSVNGYSIRFDYDDGKSETVSLLTFPKEPDFLIINGQDFLPYKKD